MVEKFADIYFFSSGIISNKTYVDDESYLEIRIAILPTKNNLNHACTALYDFLEESRLSFEILALNGGKSLEQLGWDGTFAKLDLDPRIDHRGSEICVKIKFDKESKDLLLDKRPEEIKSLIVTMWRKLQDKRVITGYVYPQQSYLPVKTKTGLLTPFSCGVRNADTNVESFQLDLTVTDEELEECNISKHDLASQEIERLAYVENHIAQAKAKLVAEIKRLKLQPKSQDLLEVLDNFKCPQNSQEFPSFLQQNRHILKQITNLIPLNKVSFRDEVEGLISCWNKIEKNQDLANNVQRFARLLTTLKGKSSRNGGEYSVEYDLLQNRYHKDDYIMGILNNAGYNGISDILESNPVELQVLHRSFKHLENEEKSFTAYKQAFEKEHNTIWANHKGKILGLITFLGGCILGGVGAALTATGVLAPLGIPLAGVALYLATVGACAGAGALITGIFSSIYYCCSKPAEIAHENRFLKEESMGSTYGGVLSNTGVYNEDDAKDSKLHHRSVNSSKEQKSETQAQKKVVQGATYVQLDDEESYQKKLQ